MKLLSKLSILIVCNFFIIQFTYAQDILVFENGEEIETKIITIDDDEISYKKYNNLDGPIYKVGKSSVYLIKYENGKKEFILETESQGRKNDKKLTIGLGIGISFNNTPIGEIESIPLIGNFYYNLTDKWSLGVESEIIFLETYYENNISSYSLKGKYFLGKKRMRTHVALGIGHYSYNSDYYDYSSIGISPEFGINFGFYQMSLHYHYLPEKEIYFEEGFYQESFNDSFNPSYLELRFIMNINFIKGN